MIRRLSAWLITLICCRKKDKREFQNSNSRFMENIDSQNLAERLAGFLQETEKGKDDFLRQSLEAIKQRLDRIESQIAIQNPTSEIQNLTSKHSSQEKFAALEELAVETVNGMPNEKACPYEPAGKPCDHCAMCNSRGF